MSQQRLSEWLTGTAKLGSEFEAPAATPPSEPGAMQTLKHVALGYGGSLAGLLAQGAAFKPYIERQIDNPKLPELSERQAKVLSRLLSRDGVSIENVDTLANGKAFRASNSHYNQVNRTIGVPRKVPEGVLAHEVGHSRQRPWSLGANIGGKAVTSLSLPLTLGMQDENNAWNAAVVGTVGGGATLANELGASLRGKAILDRLHASEQRNPRRYRAGGPRPFSARWSPFVGIPTYASSAALPMAAYGIKKMMGGYNPSTPPENKTAMLRPQLPEWLADGYSKEASIFTAGKAFAAPIWQGLKSRLFGGARSAAGSAAKPAASAAPAAAAGPAASTSRGLTVYDPAVAQANASRASAAAAETAATVAKPTRSWTDYGKSVLPSWLGGSAKTPAATPVSPPAAGAPRSWGQFGKQVGKDALVMTGLGLGLDAAGQGVGYMMGSGEEGQQPGNDPAGEDITWDSLMADPSMAAYLPILQQLKDREAGIGSQTQSRSAFDDVRAKAPQQRTVYVPLPTASPGFDPRQAMPASPGGMPGQSQPPAQPPQQPLPVTGPGPLAGKAPWKSPYFMNPDLAGSRQPQISRQPLHTDFDATKAASLPAFLKKK